MMNFKQFLRSRLKLFKTYPKVITGNERKNIGHKYRLHIHEDRIL